MRRVLALLAMATVLVIGHLVNVSFEAALRQAGPEGVIAGLHWLYAVIPLGAAGLLAVLAGLVIRTGRPDALVGGGYVFAGLGVVLAFPALMATAWDAPAWVRGTILDLHAGQAVGVWIAAGVAVLGVVELVRWARAEPVRDRSRLSATPVAARQLPR
jgi:hypothetical protein